MIIPVSLANDSYDIIIEKLLDQENESSKSMVIKIIDPSFVNITGGIVQGMSGSPIIQDDKIIGAVTHAIVNDNTKGYGIFITTMLEEGEN